PVHTHTHTHTHARTHAHTHTHTHTHTRSISCDARIHPQRSDLPHLSTGAQCSCCTHPLHSYPNNTSTLQQTNTTSLYICVCVCVCVCVLPAPSLAHALSARAVAE